MLSIVPVRRLVTRRERIEEIVAVIIPFAILALFAVLAPRFVAMVAADPPAQHVAR